MVTACKSPWRWNQRGCERLKGRVKRVAVNGERHGLGRVAGNWKQVKGKVKGKVKEKWGKLTDDDLNVIDGRRDQLEGKIQERYGHAKDQVRKDIDDWCSSQRW